MADQRTLKRLLVAVVVLAASGAVVAVFIDRQGIDPPSKTYRVDLREGAITGPATIRDRRANLRVLNTGSIPHQLQVLRLAPGHTSQLGSIDAWPAATLPSWATPVGGIAHLDPGTTATAHIDPGAGEYAFVCRLSDPSGASHASLGMVLPFSIEGR